VEGSALADHVDRSSARSTEKMQLILFHFYRTMIQNLARDDRERTASRRFESQSSTRLFHPRHSRSRLSAQGDGGEVASKRNANLQDSHAVIKNGEVWLLGMHISPYERGSYLNHDPRRTRKLLLNKREIRRLLTRVQEKGLTLVPLSVYFKGPYAKVELAIGQGKKSYDKREAIKQRDAKRAIAQRLRRTTN
jgi:SsrA-binding protein